MIPVQGLQNFAQFLGELADGLFGNYSSVQIEALAALAPLL
jgi:hypothetical protein